MKYIKKFEGRFDDYWDRVGIGNKIHGQVKEILSNDGWERKEPSKEHWDIELVYKLSDDVYIDVIKLKSSDNLNYYLRRYNSFYYINQYDTNGTELFKYSRLSNYETMMKICNYLLPYYQKRPSSDMIDDIKECFIEIEDISYRTTIDWGYWDDEYCFFPAFRFSDKLCLGIFYDINKGITLDKVKEEFLDTKSRLEIYDIHPSRAEIVQDVHGHRFIIKISF